MSFGMGKLVPHSPLPKALFFVIFLVEYYFDKILDNFKKCTFFETKELGRLGMKAHKKDYAGKHKAYRGSVKITITGDGVAHVNADDLLKSEKVKADLDFFRSKIKPAEDAT